METIKNYLENMFRNLPDTPQVQKARSELLSMMEDKYTELINEGHTENEAVGTVISEFGNLDELAEELGIVSLVRPAFDEDPENANSAAVPAKFLPAEDVAGFLNMQRRRAALIAIGVLLCITCSIPVILPESFGNESMETVGIAGLFIMIAAAVALFINAGIQAGKYNYIKKDGYVLDASSTADVADQKDKYRTTYATLLSIGVGCCILSVVPAIILENVPLGADLSDAFSGSGVLLIVGIGVFLIVLTGNIMGGFSELLELGQTPGQTVKRGRHSGKNGDVRYTNQTVSAVMSVYWPTVTSIYLIWSFLTFDWFITWIIWPVAGIFKKVIDNIWAEKE